MYSLLSPNSSNHPLSCKLSTSITTTSPLRKSQSWQAFYPQSPALGYLCCSPITASTIANTSSNIWSMLMVAYLCHNLISPSTPSFLKIWPISQEHISWDSSKALPMILNCTWTNFSLNSRMPFSSCKKNIASRSPQPCQFQCRSASTWSKRRENNWALARRKLKRQPGYSSSLRIMEWMSSRAIS